jgi:hypothetical protein
MVSFIIPISHGQEYSVGVKEGDWITYDVEIINYYSMDTEYLDIDSLILSIDSVSGSYVSSTLTYLYSNGTSYDNYVDIDVSSGDYFWIIPSGLSEGDILWDWRVNYTLYLPFAGEDRWVNSVEQYYASEDYSEYFSASWDKETGILVELYLDYGYGYNGTILNLYVLETNIWPLSNLWLSTNLSSDTVQKGEALEVIVEVSDDDFVHVNDAEVKAIVQGEEYVLSNTRDGVYEGSIDTSSLDVGEHVLTITVDKERFISGSEDREFEVESFFQSEWFQYIAIIGSVIIISLIFASLRRWRKRKKEETVPRVKTTAPSASPPIQHPRQAKVSPPRPPLRTAEPIIEKSEDSELPIEFHEDIAEAEPDEHKGTLVSTIHMVEKYKSLRKKYEEGLITEEVLDRELEELRFSDSKGNLWMIGKESGRWYRYNGVNWEFKEPPTELILES